MYRIRDSGKRLELVHRTPVGGVPGALAPFRGRLLAGVGATLRIYEAGKKKLLRKCEHRKLPTHIATLHTLGDRIYVGDLQARPWPRPAHPLLVAALPPALAPPTRHRSLYLSKTGGAAFLGKKSVCCIAYGSSCCWLFNGEPSMRGLVVVFTSRRKATA